MMKLQHTEYSFVKDDKKWKCYCTVSNLVQENGKKWRPCARGTTKREAREKIEAVIANKEKALEEARKAVETVREESDDSQSLAHQLIEYAELKQTGKVKAARKKLKLRSVNDKKELIRNLVNPYSIAKKEVSTITRKDIIAWIDEMEKNGKS